MNLLTATAPAVLLAATLSVGGLAPAFAQTANPAPTATTTMDRAGSADRAGTMRHWGHHAGPARMAVARGGGVFALACGADSSERLEIALVRLKYRVQPTAEQAPLFTALQQAALDGQKTVADACTAAMPDRTATTKPSMVDRLQRQLSLETARVSALGAIVPKFKAFYDSLTDAQKAQFEARQNRRGDRFGMKDGNRWQAGQMRNQMRGMGQGPRWNKSPAPDSTAPAAPANDTSAPADDTMTPAPQG